MSYFFGYHDAQYDCKLTIPKFANRSNLPQAVRLYSATTNGEQWQVTEAVVEETREFFIITGDSFTHTLYFLARPNEIARAVQANQNSLHPVNKLTERSPAYRANFRIMNHQGAFSSYQSEYPFRMMRSAQKTYGITSTISTLTNPRGENSVLFANFSATPCIREQPAYFIDAAKRTVLAQATITTNTVSRISIPTQLLANPHCTFYCPHTMGIPIYLAETSGHLSVEHTHPPHEYILDQERFKIVGQLKKELYEIVS